MSTLRFHAYPRPEPIVGRRLSLSGELHTLGYYSTTVCLGQPGRPFDLIVDTGSSITAVPCEGCKQCGTHLCGTNGRFSQTASPTSQAVACPLRQTITGLACEHCSQRRCEYSVRYTEGSSIRGHILNDFAHFKGASGPDARTVARVFFGCQTQETGMFHKQQADGIIGLQKSHTRSKVPSVVSSLVREKRSSNAFSLCLASSSGVLLMGGTLRRPPDPLAPAPDRVLSIPMERGARAAYTLRVQEVRVAGGQPGCERRMQGDPLGPCRFSRLNLQPSVFHPTIVDSGTTFMYASTPLWRALVDLILKSLPDTFVRVGAKHCAKLVETQLRQLPLVEIGFAANRGVGGLLLKPAHYMVEFPRLANRLQRPGRAGWSPMARPAPRNLTGARSMCIGIFDNQRAGTVIGAALMRQREVVFDSDASRISFVEADCTRVSPQSSVMRDGFAFDSCPRQNRSRAPAGGRPTRKLLSPVRGRGNNMRGRGARGARGSMSTKRRLKHRPVGVTSV